MPSTSPQLRFAADERGAVAILFSVALFTVALAVGVAIDSARAYDVRTRVQNALDAAALASAKILDIDGMTEADVRDKAEVFFRAQLKRLALPDLTLGDFEAFPDWGSSTVRTTVNVRMKSYFGDLAGIGGTFDFTPEATATYRAMRIELALVADVTGSMCDTPPAFTDPPCTSAVKLDALKTAARDMVTALYDSDSTPGAVRVALVPYSASVNAGSYASAVSGGASSDDCVVERSGPDAYTNASALSEPLGTVAPASVPYYSCVASPVRPLADLSSSGERSALLAAIDNLEASGGTAGHIGTAWGWYMLSPEWSGVFGTRAGRAWDPSRVIKVVVLMTDGQFNISYANGGETNPWPDPLSTDASHPGSAGNQALQICEALKSAGEPAKEVKIYTVAFQAPLDAETLLKTCSGEANYYDAANSAQLSSAFRDIVRRLNSLRVSS